MIHYASKFKKACQTISRSNQPRGMYAQTSTRTSDVTCERCMRTVAFRNGLYAEFPRITTVITSRE